MCFIEEESGVKNMLFNLLSLENSRDVIVRAGIFQLFSGMVTTQRGCIELTRGL